RANFFKDVIIHDVNNIFQVIRSSGELYSIYKEKSLDLEKIDDLLNMINEAGERGIKLVQNARKLSQIEESETVIQSIDLFDILNASIKIMKKHSQEQQVNIQIDAISQNVKVRANELLQDVFENILANSVKYNQNPTLEITIRISKIQKNDQNHVKLEFIDNGIGIPDFKKELIFEKGSKEKGGKGLGFGLSLVKKIVESYKGKIWVEDRVEGDYTKGSNFVLLIPEAL
ncbi:MAG: sensor histidine kinase, partial [Promethearchaeota archaeon]